MISYFKSVAGKSRWFRLWFALGLLWGIIMVPILSFSFDFEKNEPQYSTHKSPEMSGSNIIIEQARKEASKQAIKERGMPLGQAECVRQIVMWQTVSQKARVLNANEDVIRILQSPMPKEMLRLGLLEERMIEVTVKGTKIIEKFPEGTPDNVIQKTMQEKYPPPILIHRIDWEAVTAYLIFILIPPFFFLLIGFLGAWVLSPNRQ